MEQHSHQHEHDHDHGNDHDHGHSEIGQGKWMQYSAVIISLFMVVAGMLTDHFIQPAFFTGWLRFA